MKKVVIASKNPVKIQAVREGFENMFPKQEFEFIGISAASDVADQPFGDAETLEGATNRAENASKAVKDADFYVGIEGGIEKTGEDMEVFAWIVIRSGSRFGRSRTGTFLLPKRVAELIKGGEELGDANDIVFESSNSKQRNGAVGILTGDVIDRTRYYREAVILALIPFRNERLY